MTRIREEEKEEEVNHAMLSSQSQNVCDVYGICSTLAIVTNE